jgi:8-oxo-dGTP pyrophosphatase MutT (NUDIX family)
MGIMSKNPRRIPRQQYGVVPYRVSAAGQFEILLITTRETRRWMVPKGWPIKKLGPLGTGLREAFEEAGVTGDGGPPVGEFHYPKVLRSGEIQHCRVELFALRVTDEKEEWPERKERDRQWFAHHEAAAVVQEEHLQMILLDFPGRLAAAS